MKILRVEPLKVEYFIFGGVPVTMWASVSERASEWAGDREGKEITIRASESIVMDDIHIRHRRWNKEICFLGRRMYLAIEGTHSTNGFRTSFK